MGNKIIHRYTKKRDYKTVQVGFKSRLDYERFHDKAVELYGNNRLADCRFIRKSIDDSYKKYIKAREEKAESLVRNQEIMNRILHDENVEQSIKDQIKEMQERSLVLWVY